MSGDSGSSPGLPSILDGGGTDSLPETIPDHDAFRREYGHNAPFESPPSLDEVDRAEWPVNIDDVGDAENDDDDDNEVAHFDLDPEIPSRPESPVGGIRNIIVNNEIDLEDIPDGQAEWIELEFRAGRDPYDL